MSHVASPLVRFVERLASPSPLGSDKRAALNSRVLSARGTALRPNFCRTNLSDVILKAVVRPPLTRTLSAALSSKHIIRDPGVMLHLGCDPLFELLH